MTTSTRKDFDTKNMAGKYKFRIRAYKNGIYSEYSYSNYIDIEDTSKITTPTNLQVDYSKYINKFTIQWNDDYISIDAYISWKKSGESSWSSEKIISNAISYESINTSDMVGFKEGDSYKFRVRIKKDGAYSDYVESGYIQAGDKPKPNAPTNLTVDYLKIGTTFQLSWDVEYSLFDYDGSYISWKKLGGSWSDEQDTTIKFKYINATDIDGLGEDQSYKFRVRIKKDGVYSDYVESSYISTN